MKLIVFAFSIVLFLFVSSDAQTVSDADKRGFDDLRPIRVDLDGDGKLETIRPRTYRVSVRRSANAQQAGRSAMQNWIAFDLITGRGEKINSFFRYNYGTAQQGGSYWVYALVPAGDLNRDNKRDLVFYSGDDTSDETITLVSSGNRYIVLKKDHRSADQ